MINNIIFKNIDLSLDGLFADGQIFNPSNYFNCISADNGMGKTTIYNLLKDGFPRNDNNKIDLKILKELIFINLESALFDDIFIKSTLLFLQSKNFTIYELEKNISIKLGLIMRNKINRDCNKVGGFNFQIKIDSSRKMHILNENSENITHSFEAMSERVALLLSLNFTVRKLLKIKIPIVCDGLFSGMDPDIISGIFSESLKENAQLIIFEHPSFWEKLQLKPTLEIIKGLNKKHIIINRLNN